MKDLVPVDQQMVLEMDDREPHLRNVELYLPEIIPQKMQRDNDTIS